MSENAQGTGSDEVPEVRAVVVENEDGTGTPVPTRLLALADYVESLQD